jgi:hypothetical protein
VPAISESMEKIGFISHVTCFFKNWLIQQLYKITWDNIVNPSGGSYLNARKKIQ